MFDYGRFVTSSMLVNGELDGERLNCDTAMRELVEIRHAINNVRADIKGHEERNPKEGYSEEEIQWLYRARMYRNELTRRWNLLDAAIKSTRRRESEERRRENQEAEEEHRKRVLEASHEGLPYMALMYNMLDKMKWWTEYKDPESRAAMNAIRDYLRACGMVVE